MTPDLSRLRVRERRSYLARTLREAVRPARLLLVAKTALAVGLAWTIAPHMPGVTDEYPYYAPLGALVSMYPTLMGSMRSSLQTLFGLATGIGLAALIVLTVGPTWWTIPLVVGLGVLVSGTSWFGVGKEYDTMAALFVLIIGGQNSDDYSLGYLAQMGVGIVIGLVVNLLFAPAPLIGSAEARVEEFRRQLAGQRSAGHHPPRLHPPRSRPGRSCSPDDASTSASAAGASGSGGRASMPRRRTG